MTRKKSFKPAWWLKNAHLQTIWPTIFSRKISIALRRERLELPDGDFLDLDFAGETHSKHIVIILHGLGGSINSPYAKGMMKAFVTQGWQSVFMHFRGCSGEWNRLPRAYHFGETGDLNFVVQELSRRFPETKLSVVGYSLGGNVLLKWLSETAAKNFVKHAVAISVPFELHKAANRMRLGLSRFYQWWFLRDLKKSVQSKFETIPSPINLDALEKIQTFWEFDDKITAPLHGFSCVDEYYNHSSSRQYLKNIQTPTLIIHALDDPFMTVDSVPGNEEISKYVTLEISQYGGHAGFIAGSTPGRPKYWLEERVVEYLYLKMKSS